MRNGQSILHLDVVAGVFLKGKEVMIAQRKKGKHMELKWDFPDYIKDK